VIELDSSTRRRRRLVVEMNWAHFHIIINHIPIIGVPIVLIFLIVGLWMRNTGVIKATLVGFALLGAISVLVAASGLAGQRLILAEIEDVSQLVYNHKIAGIISAVMMVILGVWSGLGAAVLRSSSEAKYRKLYPMGALILAVVTSGVLFWTASRGVMINHPEVVRGREHSARLPAATAPAEPAPQPNLQPSGE
jgi:hypothetical protein